MVLEGLDELERRRSFESISLKIELYKTRPTFQPGPGPDKCYTDKILEQRFKPDVNENLDVTWINIEKSTDKLSTKQVAERVFELFIGEINKPRTLNEIVPGGRYLVDGELVNAWGEPIDPYEDED